MNRRRLLATGSAALCIGAAAPLRAQAESKPAFTTLKAEEITKQLVPGAKAAKLWAFNGQCPGPELRIKQGGRVRVKLENALDEPTILHWHGLRLANAMDGSPLTQNPVKPGETFEYDFAAPDAGTYWYHPHMNSSRQVERGLYGPLIVEEAQPPADTEDVTLVLDDWLVESDGSLNEKAFGSIPVAAHAGRLGNWFTVNGQSRPRLKLPAAKRLRLRLINCANSRILQPQFKGADPVLIALDGQPLKTPRALGASQLELAPGARADVIIRRDTSEIVLANLAGGEPLEIAYIERTGQPGEPDKAAIDPLASNNLAEPVGFEKVEAKQMVMEGGAMGGLSGAKLRGRQVEMRELVQNGMVWALNGTAGMTEEPFATYKKGDVAVIEYINKTAWPHAMHMHGMHVQEVEIDGKPVPEPTWRDTVLVLADQRVKVAFVADNPGKWMLHCHMLEHQEAGMMTWIDVTP